MAFLFMHLFGLTTQENLVFGRKSSFFSAQSCLYCLVYINKQIFFQNFIKKIFLGRSSINKHNNLIKLGLKYNQIFGKHWSKRKKLFGAPPSEIY
jgi:hypothetical protein